MRHKRLDISVERQTRIFTFSERINFATNSRNSNTNKPYVENLEVRKITVSFHTVVVTIISLKLYVYLTITYPPHALCLWLLMLDIYQS